MDFRSVTGVTIPAGSVNKISIGGVVVWNKPSGNRYKILNNTTQVAKVTMSQFVNAIQSGAAQEDWGIGAQIVVPYHDSWDNNDYELPFIFGTFTQYPGKLGLLTEYGIPSTTLRYAASTTGTTFKNSYLKQWLNAYGTEHNLTETKYVGKVGFLGCLPQDFVEAISEEVKILSGREYCLDTSSYTSTSTTYDYKPFNQGTDFIWEYWQAKVGTKRKLPISTNNSNYRAYNVAKRETVTNRMIDTIFGLYLKTSGNLDKLRNLYFTGYGKTDLNQSSLEYSYQPACYIG